MNVDRLPTGDDVRAVRPAVDRVIRRTPTLEATSLTERFGGSIVLKAENLQRTGSFKVRGATAKMAALDPHGEAGGTVVTGSAGNHAQAVALAARSAGRECHVFMPASAPIAKIEGARALGAVVHDDWAAVDEALLAAHAWSEERGATFVHPFDDPAVIAGQGTLALEVLEDTGAPELVVVPLGGGGLISGVALALRDAVGTGCRIVGVQAEQCAPWLERRAHPTPTGGAGHQPGPTIADGIAVKRPGDLTQRLVDALVDDVVAVGEDAIGEAMIELAERAKLLVEGAGAVGVAALLAGSVVPPSQGTTVIVLSGGNVDVGLIAALTRRHETLVGRRLVLNAVLDDRPGALAAFVGLLATQRVNLIDVNHLREGIDLHLGQTSVRVVAETRSAEHSAEIVAAARRAGFAVHAEPDLDGHDSTAVPPGGH